MAKNLFRVKFAENLKKLMAERKMTYDDVGKIIGKTRQNVFLYTAGKAFPAIDALVTLADFFDVSVDFLLTGNRLENKKEREKEKINLSDEALDTLKALSNDKKTWPVMADSVNTLLADPSFFLAFFSACHDLEKISSEIFEKEALEKNDVDDFEKMLSFAWVNAHQSLWEFFRGFLSKNTGEREAQKILDEIKK